MNTKHIDGVGCTVRIILLVLILFISGCAPIGEPNSLVQPLREPPFSQPAKIEFDVMNPWNDNGVLLVEGHTYTFQVKASNWCDGADPTGSSCRQEKGIPSSLAEGWLETPSIMSTILKPMSFLRRCPQQPWYALTGVIHVDGEKENKDYCFLIGDGGELVKPEATGRLFVFANDSYTSTYENNYGTVELKVIRVK